MSEYYDRADARSKAAKALWFLEVGDDRPKHPADVQKKYDRVKDDMLKKAVRLEKLLGNLGYELRPK